MAQENASEFKIRLDEAKSVVPYKNADELNEIPGQLALNWKAPRTHSGQVVFAAIIDGNAESLRPPIYIRYDTRKYAGKFWNCENLGDLKHNIEVAQGAISTVACAMAGLPRPMPLTIMNLGAYHTYEDIATEQQVRVIANWDRYVLDCRRQWIASIEGVVLEKTRKRCWYCGERLFLKGNWDRTAKSYRVLTAKQARVKFQVDHQTPISRGGTDEIENLVPACAFCNTRKGSRRLGEYRKWLVERLIQEFPLLHDEVKMTLLREHRFWGEREATIDTRSVDA